MQEPFWMVGMMGAGKSSVGRALAGRLGVPFLDVDAEIEERAGAKVAEIFESEGEEAFRMRESEIVLRAGAQGRGVVSLGGGAMGRPEVRSLVTSCGTMVYLRAHPATLAQRAGGKGERPLLRGLDEEARVAKLEALLEAREPAYTEAALILDTDSRSRDEIVDDLARRLREPS